MIRPRFSIRTLLILVSLVGLYSAFSEVWDRPQPPPSFPQQGSSGEARHRAEGEQADKHGGEVQWVEHKPSLESAIIGRWRVEKDVWNGRQRPAGAVFQFGPERVMVVNVGWKTTMKYELSRKASTIWIDLEYQELGETVKQEGILRLLDNGSLELCISRGERPSAFHSPPPPPFFSDSSVSPRLYLLKRVKE